MIDQLLTSKSKEVNKMQLNTKEFVVEKKFVKQKNFIKNFKYEFTFNNEIYVYYALTKNKYKFTYMNHPKLISYTKNENFYISFIEHKEVSSDEIDKENLVKALLEFQNASIFNYETDLINNSINRLRMNLTLQTIKWILCRSIKLFGRSTTYKLCKIVIDLSQRNKNNIRLNQHNDFYKNESKLLNNILLDKNENIYFIDFESAINTRKWIFLDIVDLCFGLNFHEDGIDFEMLELYLIELSNTERLTDELVKDQIHFALIRMSLKITNSKTINCSYKQKWLVFCKEILVNNKKYNEWYKSNNLNRLLEGCS